VPLTPIQMSKLKSLLALAVLVLLPASTLNSQWKVEAGPYIGISWYNGDLNPSKQFYNIHPAFGGLLRYVFNDRLALRGNVLIAGVSGEYPAKDVYLPENNPDNYSFKRDLLDIAMLFEINLFSFDNPSLKKSAFTPYMAFGVGSVFYERYTEDNGSHNEKPSFVLSLPFGAGVKWKAGDRLNLGAEWTLRKIFADDLDVVGFDNSIDGSNPIGFSNTTITHNNDWCSVFGVYATFTILGRRDKCRDGF
jgi:hypothetical protein